MAIARLDCNSGVSTTPPSALHLASLTIYLQPACAGLGRFCPRHKAEGRSSKLISRRGCTVSCNTMLKPNMESSTGAQHVHCKLYKLHVQVLSEILSELQVGEFVIKLNHRRLLDAMMDMCGVPASKFRPICR